MAKITVLSQQPLFDDDVRVRELRYTFEHEGKRSPPIRKLLFDRGQAVACLLYNPKKKMVTLVRQPRLAVLEYCDGMILEIVAGRIKPGEDPAVGVIREVEEETGYAISLVEKISAFYPSPGASTERVWLYYAEIDDDNRVSPGGGLAEEFEYIEVVELPFAECLAMAERGDINDGKSLLALYWLDRRLRG